MTGLSTLLSEDFIEQLDEEATEDLLCRLEMWTLAELKGKFTEDEIQFIWQHIVQGLDYEPVTEPKMDMIYNIATALEDIKELLAGDELDCEKNIRNSLIEKLVGLTSFQAYTLNAVLNRFAQEEAVETEKMYRAFR